MEVLANEKRTNTQEMTSRARAQGTGRITGWKNCIEMVFTRQLAALGRGHMTRSRILLCQYLHPPGKLELIDTFFVGTLKGVDKVSASRPGLL